MIINVLSLWQPWAQLWLADLKRGETRHFPNRFTGLIAIHATMHIETDFCKSSGVTELLRQCGFTSYKDLPRGAIIGTCHLGQGVKVESVRETLSEQELSLGNFDDGRYWWPAENKVELIRPVYVKGQQSVPWKWEVPPIYLEDFNISRIVAQPEQA